MGIDPHQDIWFGILVHEDDSYNFFSGYDYNIELCEKAVEQFCQNAKLKYMWLGNEDGIIIGHCIASWGNYDLKKVDLSELVTKEQEARQGFTVELTSSVQEFLKTEQTPETWAISYMF